MCYLRKGYLFQRHLCKNTDELIQEENIEKFSVPQVYLGPCQLSMIDFFAKMVKDFWSYTISEKNISIASDVWQGSKYTSTSFIQFFHSALNINHDISISYGNKKSMMTKAFEFWTTSLKLAPYQIQWR